MKPQVHWIQDHRKPEIQHLRKGQEAELAHIFTHVTELMVPSDQIHLNHVQKNHEVNYHGFAPTKLHGTCMG